MKVRLIFITLIAAVFVTWFLAWRHERMLRREAITTEVVLADCLDRSRMKPGTPFLDAADCGRKWDGLAGTDDKYRKVVLEHFGEDWTGGYRR